MCSVPFQRGQRKHPGSVGPMQTWPPPHEMTHRYVVFMYDEFTALFSGGYRYIDTHTPPRWPSCQEASQPQLQGEQSSVLHSFMYTGQGCFMGYMHCAGTDIADWKYISMHAAGKNGKCIGRVSYIYPSFYQYWICAFCNHFIKKKKKIMQTPLQIFVWND